MPSEAVIFVHEYLIIVHPADRPDVAPSILDFVTAFEVCHRLFPFRCTYYTP
jgi:hypothetical protein